jgi:CRISPR-associated exonuclease Cas4
MDETAEQLTLTVTDIRQWVYCPRIVYYTYCLKVKRPVTCKMEEGILQHERVTELESRRTLRSYGLRREDEGRREFKVSFYSARLGLSGLLDMAIVTPHEVIPVEYKDNTPAASLDSKRATPVVALNHKYQLTAYALLAEEKFGLPVRRSFVHYIPTRQSREVLITPEMRRFVLNALVDIRKMLAAERLPPPTSERRRCRECEFRRFCGDID